MRAMVKTSSIEVEKILPYSWGFQFSWISEPEINHPFLKLQEFTQARTKAYPGSEIKV